MDQFFGHNLNLGQRCEILDLFVLSARELSDWKATKVIQNASDSTFDQVVEHLRNCTWKSSRGNQVDHTKKGKNAFSPHLSIILANLAGRYSDTR